MPKGRAHARHVRTRRTDSTRPQRRARALDDPRPHQAECTATDSACRSVDSVTRTWRLLLQVLTPRSAAHTLSQTLCRGAHHRTAGAFTLAAPNNLPSCRSGLNVGGPILASYPGSILASAEGLRKTILGHTGESLRDVFVAR